MMKRITEVLSGLELYFRQTHQQCTEETSWFTRWLYIPVEERMQILDDLLMPYPAKPPEKRPAARDNTNS
ncbi:hypothetical protein [Yersinia alsatica]|uniref:hypothetical protein n=1 Tax=Yersinia alsatica TaxID=2890317 RepID=UPI003D9A572B